MLPSEWGKHAWPYLHTVTFNYPLEPTYIDKIRYKNFFHSLILPCDICDISYNFILKQFTIDEYLNDESTDTKELDEIVKRYASFVKRPRTSSSSDGCGSSPRSYGSGCGSSPRSYGSGCGGSGSYSRSSC